MIKGQSIFRTLFVSSLVLGVAACSSISEFNKKQAEQSTNADATEHDAGLALTQPDVQVSSGVLPDTIRVRLVPDGSDKFAVEHSEAWKAGAEIIMDKIAARTYGITVDLLQGSAVLLSGSANATLVSGKSVGVDITLSEPTSGTGSLVIKIKQDKGDANVCHLPPQIRPALCQVGQWQCSIVIDPACRKSVPACMIASMKMTATAACGEVFARDALVGKMCDAGMTVTQEQMKLINCEQVGGAIGIGMESSPQH